MTDTVDVAIIGAGPYGLSLAAHLRAAGVEFRQFGLPMDLWRNAMPNGMFLKSNGFASNLSDPEGTHTLSAFCRETGRTYGDYAVPVPLETFRAYGDWFQQLRVPELEQVLVAGVTKPDGRFELSLADGREVSARRVVVATGVEHFARAPMELAGLPRSLCTHASAHTDLAAFRGKDVVVVGAGQSALESAALLHEHGANVRVIARAGNLVWNGDPLPWRRTMRQRMGEPEAGLGSGWSTWFYSNKPNLFRHLPAEVRVHRARTALGPAGAWWLRRRVDGQFPVLLGHRIAAATMARDNSVELTLRGSRGEEVITRTEHVIAATGYRPDLERLTFLDPRLRAKVATIDGAPAVDRAFGARVPGLFFAGPAVAPTFGPVMRFVYGADFAARVLGRRLAAGATAPSRAPARTAR